MTFSFISFQRSVISQVEKEMEEAFIRAVKKTEAQWASLYASNEDFGMAYADMKWTTGLAEEFIPTWTKNTLDVFKDRMNYEARKLEIEKTFFQVQNPYTVQYLENHSSNLITNFSVEQKAITRRVLANGVVRGVNPRDIAKEIRQFCGLQDRHATALIKRRELLERQKVDPKKISKEIEKAAEKYKRYRAETIARTEAMDAHAEGTMNAWRQARDEGRIDVGSMKVWVAAPGERTCPICRDLHGQAVPLEGYFLSGGRQIFRPPAHPDCRCPMTLKMKK